MSKTRILVVDDSALVRQILTELLNSDPSLEVVGGAADPYIAREKIKELQPDVITLDVEMPRMDGVTFLRNLMRLHPMPVVMVSTLTEHGAGVTLEALELGAIDYVTKPKIDVAKGLDGYREEIIEKIKIAAKVHNSVLEKFAAGDQRAGVKRFKPGSFKTTNAILAIGASTGGTEAIKEVVQALPPDGPGTVITQHIPAAFSGPFAERVNGLSAMVVSEASDGDQILPGHAYIAPGDYHLTVERDGARFVCRLDQTPHVNRHRPSVDVMFRSVARNVGANAIGVILTGMGKDGAVGMLEMREAGAPTIAQDERSSVVWGMPGSAVEIGAADDVLPLDQITGRVLGLLKDRDSA